MSNPTVSASLDKASYAKGDLMTLTVTFADADTETLTVTIVARDKSGNPSDPATVVVVIDPTSIEVSDSGDRDWAEVSRSDSVAVLTATA